MPTYEPHIDSLRQHTTPEWYKDAKIGIYTHCQHYLFFLLISIVIAHFKHRKLLENR